MQDPLGGPRSDRDVTLTADDAWSPKKTNRCIYIYIIYIYNLYTVDGRNPAPVDMLV